MSDAEDLNNLLAARRLPGADRDGIEAEIFTRFGVTQAILFTDLVGFSRIVEEFGIVHFLELIAQSHALFGPLIREHRGTRLKEEGDSLMLVFDRPEDALRCAQAMVAATHEFNKDQDEVGRIEVCIGLGYGEVLRLDGHEIWGAEVNAASKLGEDIANGSEILATDSFRDAVPDAAWVEHGPLFGNRMAYRDLTGA